MTEETIVTWLWGGTWVHWNRWDSWKWKRGLSSTALDDAAGTTMIAHPSSSSKFQRSRVIQWPCGPSLSFPIISIYILVTEKRRSLCLVSRGDGKAHKVNCHSVLSVFKKLGLLGCSIFSKRITYWLTLQMRISQVYLYKQVRYNHGT